MLVQQDTDSIGEVAVRLQLPRWLLAAGKPLVEGIGSATSRFRVDPDYVIIGGQRCGTSALNRYLWEHPNVLPAMYKELHFFDVNHERGLHWYRGHFPTTRHRSRVASRRGGIALSGEATPYYLFHPLVPERLAAALPNARLIVVLRDPVARAISHYHHERHLGIETLGLSDALEIEDERLAGEEDRIINDPTYTSFAHQNFSYKARGRYAAQLSRWLDRFPRGQLLVIETNALFYEPAREFERVTSFLGLPPVSPDSFGSYNSLQYAKDQGIAASLRDYFRPHNQQVYDLLGRNLGWD
jgi:Sulfotransferase domain